MPATAIKTDQEIQQDVFRELRWDSRVEQTEIGVEVDNGTVTLTGTETPSKADPKQLRKAIEEALERRAEREAEKIRVTMEDGIVTLEGRVRTWPEKDAVLGTVSHAPGVQHVTDHLSVSPWE